MEAASTAALAPTDPDSPLRDKYGRLDIHALIALRREGMTLQQIGTLVGTTRERIRQLLVRAGFDPKVGPEARKAAVRVQRERDRWASLPKVTQEFIYAARRDGYVVETGSGERPLLRVDGKLVRVHRGSIYTVKPDRRYARVTATDPEIIHLVRLPGSPPAWYRLRNVSRERRATIIPLNPHRGRWRTVPPVDLSKPGMTQVLLEEEPHGRGRKGRGGPASVASA